VSDSLLHAISFRINTQTPLHVDATGGTGISYAIIIKIKQENTDCSRYRVTFDYVILLN
jgi:hypothetical protein